MKEQLTAEVEEKEWLIAELQKTKQAESCSHDNDLDSSKPHLPLLENSQLLESFVDPVKEERVEMQLLVTPLPVKKGRGGRKRKASPPVKPADSVPHVCACVVCVCVFHVCVLCMCVCCACVCVAHVIESLDVELIPHH